ncbi:hypothetical protein ACTWQL_03740 [Pseudalkalibacillus sp. R45]|uniref:hypothetical protein n=1 Tax=Pseudalkalibacillus sp. R45 TaxID=3457433 RepID=UPI003FCD2FDD
MKKIIVCGLVVLLSLFTLLPSSLIKKVDAATYSQAEKLVNVAESKAYYGRHYYIISSEDQIRVSEAFEYGYNSTKRSLRDAENAVNSLTNSSERKELNDRLDMAKTRILRAAYFIDSVWQGEKLTEISSEYNVTIDNGNIAQINDAYDAFTAQLGLEESKIGKVYGAQIRDLFGGKFVFPAKVAHERTIYEVSQYRLMEDIDILIESGNIEIAHSEMAKLDRLKKRAHEIKAAGGYQELPLSVYTQLQVMEDNLIDKLNN